MPKPHLVAGDAAVTPAPDPRTWSDSPGTYIAGRAWLDEADTIAAAMEAKWGADRLRLLVGPELREKFDRQRYLLNQAIWHGDLEAVRRESRRTVNAWLALDRAATAAGKAALDPHVWEVAVPEAVADGRAGYVAAIVPDNSHAAAVATQGRQVVVFTLEEIAHLLAAMPAVIRAKQVWPGAAVTAVRRSVGDPLLMIDDASRPLDETELDF